MQQRTAWTIPTWIGWSLLLFGAVVVVLTSARYFTLDPDVFFERQREVYEAHKAGLVLHIGGMVVAALLGPFQFLRGFRNRHLALHRLTGRLYITGAIVGGLGGLYMAQYSASGIVSGVGFSLLAIATLGTTSMAFWQIKQGNVQQHREWMTRSYALIFAAVMLRVYLPLLESFLSDYDAFAVVAWLCWLPNLVVAELMIRGGLRRQIEPARPNRPLPSAP